jgi:lysozyme family protein
VLPLSWIKIYETKVVVDDILRAWSESMFLAEFSKRQFLRLSAGVSGALFVESTGFAQDDRLFGVKLPKELMAVLPAKPLNLARSVDTVLRLEREADAKGLPPSPLSRELSGAPILANDDSIYQALLPRLVSLIDRSELKELGLAEQAGGLLAELHATEHSVPEALQTMQWRTGFPATQSGVRPLGIDSGPQANIELPAAEATAEASPPPAPPAGPEIIFQPNPAASNPATPNPASPEVPVADETETPEERDTAPKPERERDEPLRTARDFASLKSEYGRLFSNAEPDLRFAETIDWHVAMLRKSKPRYASVGDEVGVPWYFIGVIHALEASFNFRAHLHNGDFPLTSRTRQVPAGRPSRWLPPTDWESSAKDALRLLGFTGQKDWSLERTLYRLEAYNGLGYRGRRVASPYLWCYSNHYSRGKFVADGKWSPTARSKQCGAAVMLKMLDKSNEISF